MHSSETWRCFAYIPFANYKLRGTNCLIPRMSYDGIDMDKSGLIVRVLIPHVGLIPKVIPLKCKLFLDMVSSLPAHNVTARVE